MIIGAVRTALDVKWLGINVADDRAGEAQVARQIGGGCRRECGIDVKTVPRSIVVMLRDVDLRTAPPKRQRSKRNEKRKFHIARSTIRAPFTTARSLFVKDLGQHNCGAKGTALSFSFWRTARAAAR